MVLLHVKKGEESQFLFETTVAISVEELSVQLAEIYNGRLRIERLADGELFA